MRPCYFNRLLATIQSLTMDAALPHSEVEATDFYKHIESEGLPEPRRMRQLLTWCATRAMGEKPSGTEFEDQSARMAGETLHKGVPGF
jgi:kinetochore protein Mis13/DSN1